MFTSHSRTLFLPSVPFLSKSHRHSPKDPGRNLPQSSADRRRAAKGSSCLMAHIPSGRWTRPHVFLLQLLQMSFCDLSASLFFTLCILCWWFHCLKWPKHSGSILSRISKYRKSVMCLPCEDDVCIR